MVVKQMVSNKLTNVYYFLHPDTIVDEESGEFTIPSKGVAGKEVAKDDIPVIESDDPNVEASIASEETKK